MWERVLSRELEEDLEVVGQAPGASAPLGVGVMAGV
jgi:hypothetical protein